MITQEEMLASLPEDARRRIAARVEELRLEIREVRTFEESQNRFRPATARAPKPQTRPTRRKHLVRPCGNGVELPKSRRHRDRPGRFGFDRFKYFAQLHTCTIRGVNQLPLSTGGIGGGFAVHRPYILLPVVRPAPGTHPKSARLPAPAKVVRIIRSENLNRATYDACTASPRPAPGGRFPGWASPTSGWRRPGTRTAYTGWSASGPNQ